jgi:hypothetical protein
VHAEVEGVGAALEGSIQRTLGFAGLAHWGRERSTVARHLRLFGRRGLH